MKRISVYCAVVIVITVIIIIKTMIPLYSFVLPAKHLLLYSFSITEMLPSIIGESKYEELGKSSRDENADFALPFFLFSGASVMLFSPQDERKLHMLENSLNFRFKRIGTPGAKEIAEASAEAATKR